MKYNLGLRAIKARLATYYIHDCITYYYHPAPFMAGWLDVYALSICNDCFNLDWK